MNKGLHQFKLKLLNKQLSDDLPSGEQLFKRLAQVWEEFFYQILPTIECIFYRLRVRRIAITVITLARLSCIAHGDDCQLIAVTSCMTQILEHIRVHTREYTRQS